ncbi:MAG: SDR family oxidoreductase [Pseudomonadota bacterium]
MARPVALITGAARGIGRGIAEHLAADYDLALTYHTSDPADVLAACPGSVAIKSDLADVAAAEHIVAETLAAFGRLDAIVNNAGYVADLPIDRADAEAYRSTFAINVEAPMALLAAALPHLKRGAAVVNISSVNSRLPPVGAPAYAASKAALETFTVAAAKALGPQGIRVNAIAPGAIERPESPRPDELIAKFVENTALGRVGTPVDIARGVHFLVGKHADFITGQVLCIDGGYRL